MRRIATGRAKKPSQNGCGEGDSPILLRRLRKIGTVPGRFEIAFQIGPSRMPSHFTPQESSARTAKPVPAWVM